jgi:hypothetical protein
MCATRRVLAREMGDVVGMVRGRRRARRLGWRRAPAVVSLYCRAALRDRYPSVDMDEGSSG